jgi:CRISPR/Cas system-associated exonuclease Cas4 (RecB family)
MKQPLSPFDWSLAENSHWPPYGKPSPPFGPTAVEVIRSCALRLRFETSTGYERRTEYSARVGIAFHRTLQSLTEDPLSTEERDQVSAEALHRFHQELEVQEQQRSKRIREQTLQLPEERIQRARVAIVTEAQRIARYASQQKRLLKHKPEPPAQGNNGNSAIQSTRESDEHVVWAEVPVQSHDGLLSGRVDYAERLPGGGIRLLDYKSALRDDVPERYERQLQLYALLWYETFGEWPVEASLYYSFTGTMHPVTIQPHLCSQEGNEARQLVKRFLENDAAMQQAAPGTVCTVCEFRPWCQAFWKWQAGHKVSSEALTNAFYGFEGPITHLELKEQYWRVAIKWREAEILIVAPQERFPHLNKASVGTRIRAIDMRLQGQRSRPRAVVSERSELYLLANE